MSKSTISYRVIRADAEQGLVVGDFATYSDAIRARDDDVIALLACTGG